MNKRINKFTIMLAAAIISSIPCAAFADVNKDTNVQNDKIQNVQEVNKNNKPANEVKAADTKVNEEKNDVLIGWKKNSNGSYSLLDGKGSMIKSDWCKVGGKWYYFDANGIMQKGWIKSDGKWYSLDDNGNPKSGWVSERNNWYHMDGNGAMQTGWTHIDGSWYYFNGQGEMASGWKQISGKWYFFDNSGKMLSNTVIDGCKLGPNGNWI